MALFTSLILLMLVFHTGYSVHQELFRRLDKGEINAIAYRLQDEKQQRLVMKNDVDVMMSKLGKLELIVEEIQQSKGCSAAKIECQRGSKKHENSCYYFGQEFVSWLDAAVICKSLGGHLAVIETPQEQSDNASPDYTFKVDTNVHVQFHLAMTNISDDGVNGKTCPAGWDLFHDNCFIYVNEPLIWDDAKARCQAMSANLAEVYDRDTDLYLTNMVSSHGTTGDGPWLGATDRGSEGHWVWATSKKPVTYVNWYEGSTNGGRIENCLHYYRLSDLQWNDAQCDLWKFPFICESPAI